MIFQVQGGKSGRGSAEVRWGGWRDGGPEGGVGWTETLGRECAYGLIFRVHTAGGSNPLGFKRSFTK